MKICPTQSLLILVLAAAGCSNAEMSGKAGGNTSADGQNQVIDQLGSEAETDDDEIDEEDLAIQPTQVSGAFLSCVAVDMPASIDSDDSYGCDLHKKSKKVAHAEFKATHRAVTLADRSVSQSVRFIEDDPFSRWHLIIRVPRGTAAKYQIESDVLWLGSADQVRETLITTLPVRTHVSALRFGVEREYHVGNNRYSGGSCKLKIANNQPYGPLLTFKVLIKESKTDLDITIGGICGVDRLQAGGLRVRNQFNKILAFTEILRTSESVALKLRDLPAGTIQVEIFSVKQANGDHDDFVIGDLSIVGNKPIQSVSPYP